MVHYWRSTMQASRRQRGLAICSAPWHKAVSVLKIMSLTLPVKATSNTYEPLYARLFVRSAYLGHVEALHPSRFHNSHCRIPSLKLLS